MSSYRPPALPEDLARRVLRVLRDRGPGGGFMEDVGDPAGNVRRVEPDAWRVFGRATVEAAAASLPPGTCRFCWQHALALRYDLGLALDTPATRALLGRPCRRDTARLPPLTARRVARAEPCAARRRDRRALVADAAVLTERVHGRPRPPAQLRDTRENRAAMQRLGIKPESYFGPRPSSRAYGNDGGPARVAGAPGWAAPTRGARP